MTAHSSEHAPAKAPYDDLSIRSIALVGGVGSVLVFVAVIAVQVVYFRYERAEYQRKVLDVPTTKIDAVLEAQREKLADAGPGANAESGERSIPIDKAMQLVLAEYQAKRAEAKETENGQQAQDGAGENAAGNVQVASDSESETADSPAAEQK